MKQELRKHVIKYMDDGLRFDGRKELEYRNISIEYGVSNTAEGSALVKMGGTEVMAGVKMSIESPYPDTPDQGTIMIGAELLPLSNPDFELGPPSINAIELARVVDRGIRESGAIDWKSLCIEPGEKVWVVSVDICPINDEGNLFDASALAAIAALKDARFPKYEDGKIDYKEKTDKGLEMKNTPLSVTVLKIGDKLIVDPLTEEESVLDARLTVATTEDGTITALQKGGDFPLSTEDISKMIDIAAEKAAYLRGFLG